MSVPAVLPVLAFVAGVSVGVLVRPAPAGALAAACFLWIVALLARHATRPGAFAVSALAGFASAGIALGGIEARRALDPPLLAFHDDYQARRLDYPVRLEGRLREDAVPNAFGASLTLDVDRVETPCAWLSTAGGVRLSVAGDPARAQRERWRAGRRVRATATLRRPTAFRNPGTRDEEVVLARRGLALVGSVKSAALVEVVADSHVLAEAAAALRHATREAVQAMLPNRPAASAIVTAILIGDRGGLTPEVQRRLQAAGTYHVIAISGGNIAILAALAFFLMRAVRISPRAASLLATALICAYGYVAGGGPSVARATLAATIYLLARAADHRVPALNALAVVALVAIVREPLEVFDPGLWLSYGATLAILLSADRAIRRRGREGLAMKAATVLAGILAGTIAAELALFPVGAYVFQRVTVAGLILNFVAIPLMTVIQGAGTCAVALFWVAPTLASAAARAAGLAATGLVDSARLVDLVPAVTWRVPAPAVWLLCAYYVGWAVALAAIELRRPPGPLLRKLAGAAIAICAFAIAAPVHVPGLLAVPARPPDTLRVTFLDVGQGDAGLIELPGGSTLLLDAAGQAGSTAFDLGERVIAPALLAFGVRRLDYLAITHGDPDHAAGALSIARDFGPRELWEGVPVPQHPVLRALRDEVGRRGGALRLVRPDDRLLIGAVELHVHHPPEPDWERQRVRNDDSIVLELRYGGVSIVLPGDVSAETERALAPRLARARSRVRVLKAAHHGSATSTSSEWLDALDPSAVVFSCGRHNRYGHPAATVLERVRRRGIEEFRTDEDGAVTVTTDGREVAISTFAGRLSRLNRRAGR
jgi:competence protein ComEC